MRLADEGRRGGGYRRITWTPSGPLGMLLFLVLLALVAALVAGLVITVLFVAIVAGGAFVLYQGGRALVGEGRRRESVPADRGGGARVSRGAVWRGTETPLQRYLELVADFDRLAGETTGIAPEQTGAWRVRRRLSRLEARAGELRELSLVIERAVSGEQLADPARPGLWELIVASTELHRYLQGLLSFPSTRGRTAQTRELQGLWERRLDLGRRRDALMEHFRETDLRPHARSLS